MKFLHTADWHLGAAPDKGRPWGEERAAAIRSIPDRMAEICRRDGIDLLLISGDIFHYPPTLQEVEELDRSFDTMPQTRIVLLAGDRDFIRPGSAWTRFRFGERVSLLSSAEPCSVFFPQWNLEVHGFSHDGSHIGKERAEELKAPQDGRRHLLMLHGGEPDCLPLDRTVLENGGWTYIALGHRHSPGIIPAFRLAAPGSPEPVYPSETGAHGYYCGEMKADNLSVTWKTFSSCEYEEMNIEVRPYLTEDDISRRIARRLTEAPEHILSVTLQGLRSPACALSAEKLLLTGRIRSILDATLPDTDDPVLSASLLARQRDILEAGRRPYDPAEEARQRKTLAFLEAQELPDPEKNRQRLSAQKEAAETQLRAAQDRSETAARLLERRVSVLREFGIPERETVRTDLPKAQKLLEQLRLYDSSYRSFNDRFPKALLCAAAFLCLFSAFALFLPVLSSINRHSFSPVLFATPLSVVLMSLYLRLMRDLDAEEANAGNLALLETLKARYLPDSEQAADTALAEKLARYLQELDEYYAYVEKLSRGAAAAAEEIAPQREALAAIEAGLSDRQLDELLEGWEKSLRLCLDRLDALREAELENRRTDELLQKLTPAP